MTRPSWPAQMSKAAKLKKKRVEDVLGGEEAWKNAPRSQSALPPAAYWMSGQAQQSFSAVHCSLGLWWHRSCCDCRHIIVCYSWNAVRFASSFVILLC